ncbi:hypothetical protein HALDL1_00970 (plasmid) [Halobacterium sp. DL1]|nr:hypothetical protein HALDL1_00970 [Halobacterium sp. DL1]
MLFLVRPIVDIDNRYSPLVPMLIARMPNDSAITVVDIQKMNLEVIIEH